MPRRVDHAERRALLARALWSIAERDGLAAATVRKVAAEADVSVGMVQHYFSTKDEMLLFALRWVGEEFGNRITARIGALPEPRDPYEVVRIILSERLPLEPQSRVHLQAMIMWLGRGVANPELADYMRDGTRVLRDYLADQLRRAQRIGRVSPRVDPSRSADALLALVDGLSSHLLQGLHTQEAAMEILAQQLKHLFGLLDIE